MNDIIVRLVTPPSEGSIPEGGRIWQVCWTRASGRRPRDIAMVAIFCPFGLFCEIVSFPSEPAKSPRTALNLFQTEVKYGK